MHTYHLNIGLNVNDSEPREQLSRTLDVIELLHAIDAPPIQYTIGAGEWEGTPERNVQATVRNHCDAESFGTLLSYWAKFLNQECVAWLPQGATRWRLAYADGSQTMGWDAVAQDAPRRGEVRDVMLEAAADRSRSTRFARR